MIQSELEAAISQNGTMHISQENATAQLADLRQQLAAACVTAATTAAAAADSAVAITAAQRDANDASERALKAESAHNTAVAELEVAASAAELADAAWVAEREDLVLHTKDLAERVDGLGVGLVAAEAKLAAAYAELESTRVNSAALEFQHSTLQEQMTAVQPVAKALESQVVDLQQRLAVAGADASEAAVRAQWVSELEVRLGLAVEEVRNMASRCEHQHTAIDAGGVHSRELEEALLRAEGGTNLLRSRCEAAEAACIAADATAADIAAELSVAEMVLLDTQQMLGSAEVAAHAAT